MTRSVRIAGTILAGGEASRYDGAAKGLLEPRPGRTIIEKLIEEIRTAGVGDVVISANDPEPYRRFGVKVVPDLRPDVGPLAGIEAALTHYAGRCEAVLFCPCDLPGIRRREFSTLISAYEGSPSGVVVAETGDFFWQPLCSIVHNGLLPKITDAIDGNVRGVRELWDDLGAVPVHFEDETAFFNVNTPDDLVRWREIQGRRR